MKYTLPKDLKQYQLRCLRTNISTKYKECIKSCKQADVLDCWKKSVVKDLIMDCDVENERNSEGYIVCPSCKSKDIVGCCFNTYLCATCGKSFVMYKDEYKELMGDDYLEVDMDELNTLLNKIE